MAQETKIYKFAKHLKNTLLSYEYETYVNGKRVVYKYADREPELDKSKQNKDSEGIRFHVTTEYMTISDPKLQEFIEHRPDFGTDIYLYDPVKVADQQLKEVEAAVAPVIRVSEITDDVDVIKYAYLAFGRSVIDNPVSENKKKLFILAQENPAKINEILDYPDSSTKLFIGLAIAKGIIEETPDSLSIKWVHNGETIVTTAKGYDVLDSLVDYLNTNEGKEVKQQIGLLINEDVKAKATQAKTSKARVTA